MKSVWMMLLLGAIMCWRCSSEYDDYGRGKGTINSEFYGEPFDKVPSIDNMRIYEANPRAFAKTNSLDAITQRLDQIKLLNINIIWLMPINTQGVDVKPFGSPYCIKDFYTIEPEYGMIEDLRRLVKEAHKRGMAVIMDWVASQTSRDHSWMQTRPEWYLRETNGEAKYPEASGSGVHTNSAALNIAARADLRREIINQMKYWIKTVNIDGYRADWSDIVPDFFWKETIDSLRSMQQGRKVIMLAEGTSVPNLRAGFDMNYGWTFCDNLEALYAGTKSVAELYAANDKEWSSIASAAGVPRTKMRFSTNHDRASGKNSDNSPVIKYGSTRGSMGAFVIAMSMGGVPMIYSSQEVAYPVGISIFKNDAVQVDWQNNGDILDEYKKLMYLHATKEVLRSGTLVTYPNADIVNFKRWAAGRQTIFIAVNVRNAESKLSVPLEFRGAAYLNLITERRATMPDSELTMGAYEYLIAHIE